MMMCVMLPCDPRSLLPAERVRQLLQIITYRNKAASGKSELIFGLEVPTPTVKNYKKRERENTMKYNKKKCEVDKRFEIFRLQKWGNSPV